ncbi:hypothetical protein [Micavibrio aeruginosavorus]|uniref:hypothetical protein n=1 Tax=Micavibrio aeruginosavorus TaxID=349221 RepID=UPI003F4ABB6B
MSHETIRLLDEIVLKTRDILYHTVYDPASDTHANPHDPMSLRAAFAGCCGLAQCIAGYAFQDLNLPVKAIATQSLDGHWRHGHAALVVEVAPERSLYLIDPTFCQFCTDPLSQSPATHLMHSDEGADLVSSLLDKGYAKLTPEKSALYLASFCNGIPPLDADAAMAFMKNPPAHPYHFKRDIDCDDFSRENLGRYNQLIDCSRIRHPARPA